MSTATTRVTPHISATAAIPLSSETVAPTHEINSGTNVAHAQPERVFEDETVVVVRGNEVILLDIILAVNEELRLVLAARISDPVPHHLLEVEESEPV